MEVEGLGEGEELWKKYCSFFDKPFSEQVEYNERKLKEYFKRWKQTKMAKQLCPKGVRRFKDVPLTTYDDYPILHEFGKRIEKLEKTVPRKKGELLWNYYGRIGTHAATILDGWLLHDYSFCVRSGGTTTGNSKWIPYGTPAKQMFLFDIMRPIILSCSENWGKTSIKPGDNILNVVAPIPYVAGYAWKFLESEFSIIPPFEIVDNINSVMKKSRIILKMLQNKKVYWLGGAASFIKLLYDYFMNPQELYRGYYQSTDLGLTKFILYLIWLKSRISGKKYENIREILPLKGIMIGGMGTQPYLDFIKSSYGLEPFILYGSAEGISMMGFPTRKMGLHPVLDWRYFEFLDKNNEIKKIDEVKKDEVYEVIGTVFNSTLIRYCVGDLLKVVDTQDDGMP
ncbi:MAG: GH3 auxin-responsive promoter family protein, partial [Hadesarchaea archaeon]|nr:GH3 auxin-responsive promoter family protein [Hadesarchaea archaeon]